MIQIANRFMSDPSGGLAGPTDADEDEDVDT